MKFARGAPPLIVALVALSGCGESELESESESDTASGSELIESAEITAEGLEDLGVAPGERFIRSTFEQSCGASPSVCRCAAEAMTNEFTPGEVILASFGGQQAQRALRNALAEAAAACAAGGFPPDRLRAAAQIPEGPVVVTPESLEAVVGPAGLSDEQNKAAFIRNCSPLSSVETCGCQYDELREQISVAEIAILSFHGADALESPFIQESAGACDGV